MDEDRKELESHGATVGGKQSYLYQLWSQMRRRCHNENHPKYHLYGARGITVDLVWRKSFAAFQEYIVREIGHRPSKDHSIDRIDNNKGYYPGNVKWSTREEQGRNKRNNHTHLFRGAQRTLQEISEMTGVDHRRLQHRVVNQGMSIEDAVNLPIEPGGEFYTYKGETHKLGEWSKILKIPYQALYDRLNKMKWSVERAFGTACRGRGQK